VDQCEAVFGSAGELAFGRAGITEIGTMAETYVPLISSALAVHLAFFISRVCGRRSRWKNRENLLPVIPGVGKGFDAMTLAALGLEEQAVRDYIKQSKRPIRSSRRG